MPKSEYVLQVGEKGADRLRNLNDMCNPYSKEFIKDNVESKNNQTLESGLKNKLALDIGCGIGLMSIELAKLVQPNGKVYATDISNKQLALAKKEAEKENIQNIEFKEIAAENIDQLNMQFDLIYCRFVLAHLKDANIVIASITKLMHKDTILICEEPHSIERSFCDPPNEAFEQWKKAVYKQVEMAGSHFQIGRNLPNLFKKNNLRVKKINTIQPMLDSPALKQQLWQGIQEISALLINSNFATEQELTQLIEQLKDFSEHSDAKVGYLECTQISALKR